MENKQELEQLVEDYVQEAIQETTNGSHTWGWGGDIEEKLGHDISDEELEQIEDLLYSYSNIGEVNVYRDDNNYAVIDCMFWLDACNNTCRHAVLFHNTKDGEKYYLQHAELLGDEQDEDTDEDLLKQAEILMANDYDISSLDEEFEIENVSNAFGIRNIIKTIEMQ